MMKTFKFQNFGQVPEFSMPKEFNQLPGKKCGLSSSHYEKQEQKSIPTSKSVDKKPACRYVTEEERKNLLDVCIKIIVFSNYSLNF